MRTPRNGLVIMTLPEYLQQSQNKSEVDNYLKKLDNLYECAKNRIFLNLGQAEESVNYTIATENLQGIITEEHAKIIIDSLN